MYTYNVFYSVKDEISQAHVAKLTAEFIGLLQSHALVESVSYQKLVSKGNFPQMADFHVAANFRDKAHMEQSFQVVRESLMHQQPHAELMKSVKEFKVTFTESLE